MSNASHVESFWKKLRSAARLLGTLEGAAMRMRGLSSAGLNAVRSTSALHPMSAKMTPGWKPTGFI
jgi:hypothetical protein